MSLDPNPYAKDFKDSLSPPGTGLPTTGPAGRAGLPDAAGLPETAVLYGPAWLTGPTDQAGPLDPRSTRIPDTSESPEIPGVPPVEPGAEPIRTLLWTAATHRPLDEVVALVGLLKRTGVLPNSADEALRAAAVARPLDEVRQLVTMLHDRPHDADEADTTLRAAAVGRSIEDVAQLVSILLADENEGRPPNAASSNAASPSGASAGGKAKSWTKPQAPATPQPNSEPNSEPNSDPEARSGTEPRVTPEARHEVRSEAAPKAGPEAQPKPQPRNPPTLQPGFPLKSPAVPQMPAADEDRTRDSGSRPYAYGQAAEPAPTPVLPYVPLIAPQRPLADSPGLVATLAGPADARQRGFAASPALGSVLRWPATAALFVIGAIHLPTDLAGLRSGGYGQMLPMIVTALCLMLGLWLVLQDTAGVWAAAAVVAAGVFALHALAGFGATDLLAGSLGDAFGGASAVAVMCAVIAAALAGSALVLRQKTADTARDI
ncbi:hypothetical protein [Streptomyces sp. NPDC088725]|uniref:hypothetical protein n=1 Tax=Streptomyces sp. NPDC088725 TaxID=3365873 RepID=UPI00380868AA